MVKDRTSVTQQRLLGWCGIAVPLVFTLGVWWAGSLWDGYSHSAQPVSDLGGAMAPNPVIQNITFLVVGLLIAAFAFGLNRSVGDQRGVSAGPLLVGSLGVAVASMSIVPCESLGCEEARRADVIHLGLINAGILAFSAGTLLLPRRMRKQPGSGLFRGYSALTGVATFVSWVAVVTVAGLDLETLPVGALQRVMVGIAFLWFGVAGFRMLLWSRSN